MAKLGWALLFCVLSTVLSACKGNKPRDIVYVEPELQPFVNQFIEDAKNYGANLEIKNLSVQMTDGLVFPEVGECIRSGKFPMVRISRAFWVTATDANKQLEVYHELGHCVLNREHDDSVASEMGSIPRSIMNTQEIDIATFLTYHEYYLCELFSSVTGATCASTNKPSSFAAGR